MLGIYFIVGPRMGIDLARYPKFRHTGEQVGDISLAILHLQNYMSGSKVRRCDVK